MENSATIRICSNCDYRTFISKDDKDFNRECKRCGRTLEVIAETTERGGKGK